MRVARWIGAVLTVLLLMLGGYLIALQLTGNFHTVVEGKFYRAAQVTPESLASYHRKHGIRTVINLRGSNPGKRWYDNEVATSRTLGIEHLNFPLSSKRPVTEEQAKALVEVMRTAAKPLLVHCESGADRTGLVAALFLAGVMGASEADAEHQLTFWFGHVALPFISRGYAVDDNWERFEVWLGYKGT